MPPRLVLPGAPEVGFSRPAQLPSPFIAAGTNLLDCAETAWLAAQIDAEHVLVAERDARTFDERIGCGYDYIAQHPDDADAQMHLWRLQDRCSECYATMRLWMRAAWLHCVEAHGFEVNAGRHHDDPPAKWRRLGLGHLSPPGSWPPAPGERLHHIDMVRPSVAGWELETYRELARVAPETRTTNGGDQ